MSRTLRRWARRLGFFCMGHNLEGHERRFRFGQLLYEWGSYYKA